jgi:two-component system, sensor histidine kinase
MPARTNSQGRLRVLVAEDNPVNRRVIEAFLLQIGAAPHLVDDGQALLTAWRDDDWDLVLTDVQMPVLDGVAAARAIRAEERARGLAPTPIVAVTANDEHRQACATAGMDAFVVKPIVFENLLDAIVAVLNR